MNSLTLNTIDFLETIDILSAQGTAVFVAIRNGQSIVDFRCLMVSPRFKQQFGGPANEGLTRSITEFTIPTEERVLLERFKQVVTNQQRVNCQNTLVVASTQSTQLCKLTLSPVGDSVMLTASLVSTPKPPLEQVNGMQVLENSFNACLNGITVYEAILDDTQEPADFRFAAINEVGLSMSGLSRQQVIGRTLREFYPPTDSFGLFSTYKQVYLTGQSYQGEHFYPDYGVWRQLVIVRISGGIMVTYHDITPHKQLQQEQQQLIDELIQQATGGAVLLDPIMNGQRLSDLRVVRCNGVYAQLRGKSAEQLSGQLMSAVAPGWQSTALFGHIQQVLTTGNPYQGNESRFIAGIERHASFRLAPVGRFLLVTYEDLTQQYHDRQHIKELVDDLQRAAQNQQEFAFVASHDLQEPLRKIQQFSGLLANQFGHQLGEGGEYLERMRASAQRLSDLLKELLDYSRLTTQLQAFKPVALSTVVNEVVKRLDDTLRQNGTQLTIDPLPVLAGDATQLELLFYHLLTNSIKFCPPGESPRIRITHEPVSLSQLPARLQAKPISTGYVCIRVIDAGIGFEQKYADRIFGVFQRLHGKQQYGGMGIGLAVCQRIVENHKGAIIAQGEVDQGTVFSVYLPNLKLNNK